jgi:hypothetical protein
MFRFGSQQTISEKDIDEKMESVRTCQNFVKIPNFLFLRPSAYLSV